MGVREADPGGAARAIDWNAWKRIEVKAVRTRLQRGGPDSMMNLLLLGISFIKRNVGAMLKLGGFLLACRRFPMGPCGCKVVRDGVNSSRDVVRSKRGSRKTNRPTGYAPTSALS